MSTHEEPVTEAPQFRIRHLFVAMVIVGVIMAFAAPFVRDATTDQRMLIVAVCVGLAAGAGLFVVATVIPRHYARKKGGAPLLQLNGGGSTPFDLHIMRGAVLAVGFLLLIRFGMAWQAPPSPVSSSSTPEHRLFQVGALATVLAIFLGQSFLPPADPQLCKNGLWWNAFLIPWKSLRILREGMLDPLYLQMHNAPFRKFRVRADQREQVEAILREHSPQSFSAGDQAEVDQNAP